MNYFLDTEFIEDFTTPVFGKPRHYIDLISIALVDETGRSYYAISKDFDVSHAWDKQGKDKKYWLRENVLKAIHADLYAQTNNYAKTHFPQLVEEFSLRTLKTLIDWYGKTNEVIKKEIFEFINPPVKGDTDGWSKHLNTMETLALPNRNPQFYAYYCNYDWVLFCSLFGRMDDLPDYMPMYCNDLKVMEEDLHRRAKIWNNVALQGMTPTESGFRGTNNFINTMKDHREYPFLNDSVHNALTEAHWAVKLHRFLQKTEIEIKT